jgi:hypothetical protein
MISVFKFEAIRIFQNKRNLFFFIALLLLCLYFLNQGVTEYSSYKDKAKIFHDYENSRVSRYVTWDQYGINGFGLLYQPSPLIVFFHNSSVFENVETNIDTTEIIKIVDSYKGKSLFKKKNSLDFSMIIFFFGSLLMMYLGFNNFMNYKHLSMFVNRKMIYFSILARLFILNAFFIFLYSGSFYFTVVRGVRFNHSHLQIFLLFALFSLILLTFFYLLGLLLFTLFSSKKLLPVVLVWFVSVFVFPVLFNVWLTNKAEGIPIKENLNKEKLGILMDFESQVREEVIKLINKNVEKKEIDQFHKEQAIKYLDHGYKINMNNEFEYFKLTADLINKYKSRTIIFPTTFYNLLSMENSSKGYLAYTRYLNHVLDIRDQFFKYYVKNRYDNFVKGIVPFIKGDENIFQAKSQLPDNFLIGFGVTCFYSLVLLGLCLLMFQRRNNVDRHLLKPFPINAAEPGMAIHAQCQDTETRNRVYNHLVRQNGVVGLDNFKSADLDIELPPRFIVPYFCYIFGVSDLRKVEENIKRLEVEDYRHFKRMKRSELNEEDLLKLYCAVMLAKAEKYDSILLNETLDKVSKDFERKFLELLDELLAYPKRVFYASNRCFENAMYLEVSEMTTDDELELSNLELKRVSLR